MAQRPIKFRVWQDGKMHYLDQMFVGVGQIGFSDAHYVDLNADDREDVVIMQYTGVKDKKGFEIYEGDIVTARHPDDEDGDMDMVRAVVVYNAPSFHAKYVDESLNDFVAGDSGFILRRDNNVVGNIYEGALNGN